MNLDKIDKRILEALRLNARISNVALGEQVGLSASACARRIRALEELGVIRGYTTVRNGASEQDRRPVFILMKLANPTADHIHRFEAAVRKCEEVRECFLITGSADYLLRIEIEHLEEFEQVHAQVLSKLPGVSSIHSSFTIRNVFS